MPRLWRLSLVRETPNFSTVSIYFDVLQAVAAAEHRFCEALDAAFADLIIKFVATGYKTGVFARIDQTNIPKLMRCDRPPTVEFGIASSGFDVNFDARQVIPFFFDQ